jgi:hypothetical protein
VCGRRRADWRWLARALALTGLTCVVGVDRAHPWGPSGGGDDDDDDAEDVPHAHSCARPAAATAAADDADDYE